MCFIILNDLHSAHHNLLGICHQVKIRHLYGTFSFSTQCICMGTGSLFVYGFHNFRGKARPLRRKTVFAVASIELELLLRTSLPLLLCFLGQPTLRVSHASRTKWRSSASLRSSSVRSRSTTCSGKQCSTTANRTERDGIWPRRDSCRNALSSR